MLVLFTLRKCQILVSKLTVLLFEFALYLVPVPLQLEIRHNTRESCAGQCLVLFVCEAYNATIR